MRRRGVSKRGHGFTAETAETAEKRNHKVTKTPRDTKPSDLFPGVFVAWCYGFSTLRNHGFTAAHAETAERGIADFTLETRTSGEVAC